ncbi:MAG: sugar ABC transporter permease [Spirochaetales bacterium]|nr:sugar ABC transporter permease [Spirochaetales bacterium]
MDNILHTIKTHMRQYAMVVALVSIMILFQILTEGILLKPLNVTNLVLQNSYILVLAIGMLLCILTGGNIDLSVGSTAAFVGAVSATFIITFNMPVVPAIAMSLVIGAFVGAWQGYWIAYVRIPAFIVTLSGMLVFRGLTMVILKGRTLAPFPVSYQKIASGFIPDFFGNGEGLHITTILIGVLASLFYLFTELRSRRGKQKYDFSVSSMPVFALKVAVLMSVINLFTYWLARYKGIPNVLVLLIVLILAYSFMTNKTIAGRHIYAFGGNEKAAKLSGVKTNRVLFGVYVNMSILAALAGIIFAGRLNAATPKAGNLFELDAIASCFIGGASATGGVGTIVGAIIGGLIMGVLNNGMSIMGISIDWQQTIKGLVLLFAVAFDVYTKTKSK